MTWDPAAGRWRCRRVVTVWSVGDGTRRRRNLKATFKRKVDAEEWERAQDRRAAGLEPLPRLVTLAEGWALYQAGLGARGSPETTLRYYKVKYERLEEHFTEVAVLNRLAPADVREYVAARQSGKHPAGNRTVRAELALLYRMTVRAGEALDFDLIPQWRMPRFRIVEHHRRVPTPEQLAALWARLHGPPLVALALCTLTGMRASEAFRAHAAHWNRGERTLLLPGRKAGDELVVVVVDTLAALLPRTGPLVKAGTSQIVSALRRASAKVGGPTITGPGIGRHIFGSYAISYGPWTETQVADALGHSAPGVTQRYLHALAVNPLRRPMAETVETVLLEALAKAGGSGS